MREPRAHDVGPGQHELDGPLVHALVRQHERILVQQPFGSNAGYIDSISDLTEQNAFSLESGAPGSVIVLEEEEGAAGVHQLRPHASLNSIALNL